MAPSTSRSVRLLVGLLAGTALAACAKGPESDPEAHSPDGRIRALLTTGNSPVLALASGDTIHLSEELKSFYAARGYEAAWIDDTGFSLAVRRSSKPAIRCRRRGSTWPTAGRTPSPR